MGKLTSPVALRRIDISVMQKLETPDRHYLMAAIGWLELGNVAEARAELEKISVEQQHNPDVLEVRWLICAEGKEWNAALDAARALVGKAPKRSSGWVHQAYALRRVRDVAFLQPHCTRRPTGHCAHLDS